MSKGYELARQRNKHVYITTGAFDEAATLQLVNGVSVYGGYDPNDWSRSDRKTKVTVAASTAINAGGLDTKTVIELLDIVGGDATTSGGSAYGIHAKVRVVV